MTLAEGPTNVRSYRDRGKPPSSVCLDANVVLDLYELQAAPRRPGSRHRHADLGDCLDYIRKKGCAIFVTPLVLEEVFHVLARKLLTKEYQRCGCCQAEKEFLSRHPVQHAAARLTALRGLREAIRAALARGCQVALPRTTSAVEAQQALETFILLLAVCTEIGGKDALHIVIGGLLESAAHVTRDGGFRSVPALTVYTKNA